MISPKTPPPFTQQFVNSLFDKYRMQNEFYFTSAGHWYLDEKTAREDALLLKDSSVYVCVRG